MATAWTRSQISRSRARDGIGALLEWAGLIAGVKGLKVPSEAGPARIALATRPRLAGLYRSPFEPSASAAPALIRLERGLLRLYLASAADVAWLADALQSGVVKPALGPVAVQALVAEVVQDLVPEAHKAGLALLRDTDSRCDGVCCADPDQLRRVLAHLLLRALRQQRAPGHVRVMVMLTRRKAHILILSRMPATVQAASPDTADEDLVAPKRLLQAMGGSLGLEPRRAGYLPLCITLPALSAAPALRAA